MSTQLDSVLTLGREAAYGQTAPRTDALQFTQETIDYKLTATDSQGMRPGRRTTQPFQRAINKIEVGGDVTTDCYAAQLGIMLEAFMGNAVHTQLPGSDAWQHLYTPQADPLPFYSFQKQVPLLNSDQLQLFTFTGMQCSALELDLKNGADPTIKTTWVGCNLDTTDTQADVPVYPVDDYIFTFVDAAITIGGTVTPPTATALAAGGTEVATVTDATITLDNGVDSAGFNIGGKGARTRPVAALLQKLTGKLTAEFSDTAFWAAYQGQAPLSLVLDFAGPAADGGNPYALQVFLPVIKLEGELPQVQAGSIVTQSVSFTAFHDVTAGLSSVYAALVNKVAG